MAEGITTEEFRCMREAGGVAAAFFKKVRDIIRPANTTQDIETFFDMYLKKYPQMEGAFKGFKGYPASVCVSVNEEIIHGIPSKEKVINEGDLVSVDLGIKYKGVFIDCAYTYLVGHVSKLAKRLAKVTIKALYEGIKVARVGHTVGDISAAIQHFVEKNGFSVVRKFVGHGIGKKLHQPPEVPNFGRRGEGKVLEEGMAIAIEPMVVAGSFDVDILRDGWTAKTKDNSLSAHFEHTVAITQKGPWILTQ